MDSISQNRKQQWKRRTWKTIHHLFIAKLKGYIDQSAYSTYRGRYKECIRMLNGLEKSLEKQLPESERRWGPPEH